MLRRLAVLIALLSPAAGLAQTSGEVLIIPAAFGVADCTSTTTFVSLSWMSPLTITVGDIYRVYVGTTSSCPTTGTPTGTQLGSDIAATSQTQTYDSTLTRADFISKAGVASCSASTVSPTIYVCVQHLVVGGGTVRTTMSGSAPLVLSPPPVPVNVSVAPGDGALFVSWADGASTGVAAASYRVTAVAQGNAGDTHTESFTGRSNNRIGGLTNNVTYDVTVTSVAAGSNESLPSAVVSGTPQPVNGFWEQYTGIDGHHEQGGCGGGAAGLFSLVGLALAMRRLRRRS
jgi:hypothetical protein